MGKRILRPPSPKYAFINLKCTFVFAGLEYVFASGKRIFHRKQPKVRFLFWKAYSSLTLIPPHRFGRIFATVTPIEVILFALVSYRAPLRVGRGLMPWFSVVICWSIQSELTPFCSLRFVRLFCRVSSVTKTKGVFHTLLVKASHDTRRTSAKL